jgi:hypothetical protein
MKKEILLLFMLCSIFIGYFSLAVDIHRHNNRLIQLEEASIAQELALNTLFNIYTTDPAHSPTGSF